MTEELKPCPFCGGEAEFSVGKSGDGSDWHYISCSDCESMGPHVNYAAHGIRLKECLSEAWNRRSAILPDVSGAEADGWQPIETAPKDGQWILALRAVTLVGGGKPDRAVPDLYIIQRTRTSPESDGYWKSSHGHSVADFVLRHALWAPLDALPLVALYERTRGGDLSRPVEPLQTEGK